MNSPHRMDDLLSRHRLGELPASLEKEVFEFLSTPEGRRRLEQLEAQDEQILRESPPRKIADQIRLRLDALQREERSPGRRTTVGWLAGSGLAVALGGLAVVASLRMTGKIPVTESASASGSENVDSVLPPTRPHPVSAATAAVTRPPEARIAEGPVQANFPADQGLRTKGEVHRLRVHRVTSPGGAAVPLANGDTARAGDLLQVSLLAGPATFAAVLSLDGNGQVSRHIPETGDSAVSLREARGAPHSFLLDNTPGFERFILVQSDRPFPLSKVESILRHAGARSSLSVPGGWTVQSILVVKPEFQP